MTTPPVPKVGEVRRQPSEAEQRVEEESFQDFFTAYNRGVA